MALALCAAPIQAAAFDVSKLYEVQVQQQGADRNQALLQALDTMLLRLTADASVLSDERVALLRRRADSYIQSYEYVNADSVDANPWLRVIFSKDSLTEALSDLGMPSWGVNRPKTLVWLVAGDPEQGHRLLRTGDSHPSVLELEHWSSRFGMPLVYPLLDLEDVSKVDSSRLWAGFDENLMQASGRYDGDVVALVRVDGWQQGQWRLRWQLYFGEETLRWDDLHAGLRTAVGAGMGRLATELGLRFGLDNFDEQGLSEFSITVSGVASFAHMTKVVSYLRSVHAIRDVQILNARRGELRVRLVSALDISGVHSAIALSTLLVPVNPEQGDYRFNAEFN